jgi:hypothetical protein
LGHIIAAVLGERNAWHFDGPPTDYRTFAYAGTAKEALVQLDAALPLESPDLGFPRGGITPMSSTLQST